MKKTKYEEVDYYKRRYELYSLLFEDENIRLTKIKERLINFINELNRNKIANEINHLEDKVEINYIIERLGEILNGE